jgi:hypothetical protein
MRDADRLLDNYDLPDLDTSYLIVQPKVWNLLEAIDLTQANLSGARMWGLDREGKELRQAESLALEQLARDAESAELISLGDRLRSLSRRVRNWPA